MPQVPKFEYPPLLTWFFIPHTLSKLLEEMLLMGACFRSFSIIFSYFQSLQMQKFFINRFQKTFDYDYKFLMLLQKIFSMDKHCYKDEAMQ